MNEGPATQPPVKPEHTEPVKTHSKTEKLPGRGDSSPSSMPFIETIAKSQGDKITIIAEVIAQDALRLSAWIGGKAQGEPYTLSPSEPSDHAGSVKAYLDLLKMAEMNSAEANANKEMWGTVKFLGYDGIVVISQERPHLGIGNLLDMIMAFLLRFVVFSSREQACVVSLWVMHTWLLEAFKYTPYLHIFSATKRSGKSRMLECLQALVRNPWAVVSASDATLFRKIEADLPTVLYDEIDTVYGSRRDKSNEGLRAVLNAGFMRGAKIPRCGNGREIIEYSVFCPKAFAGIGDRLPDTVKDRSIRIQLCRRANWQEVERFRLEEVEECVKFIVGELSVWAGNPQIIGGLRSSRPVLPNELGDRAADISEPLLAIADLAGGAWPVRCRPALVALFRSADAHTDEPGAKLLAAIREIFDAAGMPQLPTESILRKLAIRDEDEPWTTSWAKELNRGNVRGPAAKMAALLRIFEINGGTIRMPDGSTPKGYRLNAFEDAFARYLPSIPAKDATTSQPG